MSSRLPVFLWGLFLASSWTWCIGMYLPVPLLREFGWAGFLVFAIPNVVGCAAFGYVFSEERSRRFVARFPKLLTAFSTITVAYHAFFVGFVGSALLGDAERAAPGTTLMLLSVLGLSAWGLSALDVVVRSRLAWPIAGALTLLVSLVLFASLGTAGLSTWSFGGALGAGAAAWLIPTMLFGFLLCPWLDLTFHRARRESGSPRAFLIFGVTFAVMLLFSAAYAPLAAVGLPFIVVIHLMVQGVFTSAAHLRELRTIPDELGTHRAPREVWDGQGPRLVLGTIVAAALIGVVAGTEANYLRMLVFYGLIFPAVVVLFAHGSGRHARATRRLAPFLVVLLLSLPLMEAGFIGLRTWLLPWPIAAILALAAFGSGRPSGPRSV